jgi:hypothetical protein
LCPNENVLNKTALVQKDYYGVVKQIDLPNPYRFGTIDALIDCPIHKGICTINFDATDV